MATIVYEQSTDETPLVCEACGLALVAVVPRLGLIYCPHCHPPEETSFSVETEEDPK